MDRKTDKRKLSKASILSACDRKLIEVEVPEWGGVVYLRSLSLGEGLAFHGERKALDGEADDRVVTLMLRYTLCDEHGDPLFKQNEMDALNEKNPAVLGRLFQEALKLTQAGQDSEAERGNG